MGDGDLLYKELNYLFIYIDNFIVILQSASSLFRLRGSRVRWIEKARRRN